MRVSERARRISWPVGLVLVLLIVAALACNLTTKNKKETSGAQGTAVSAAGHPGVVIQAPQDNAQVLVNNDVLLYAVASDSVGVTRVELLANNFVVASQASPSLDTGDKEFRVLLKWRPPNIGQQRLEVVPWRGTVRGDSAFVNLIVRAKASDIVQTPAPTLAFITPTQIADRTCRAQIAVGALNVRSGPGLVYNIIGSANIGQELTITGRQLYPDPWWQVIYNGQLAWVSGYYVNTLGECAGIGIVLPPPPPTTLPRTLLPTLLPTPTPLPPTPTLVIPTLPPGTPTPTPTPETCRVRINSDGVPVYSGPGLMYTRMTILSSGQKFDVAGREPSGRWWQIAIAGTFGWVESKNVEQRGDCSRVGVEPDPADPDQNLDQHLDGDPHLDANPDPDHHLDAQPDPNAERVRDRHAVSIGDVHDDAHPVHHADLYGDAERDGYRNCYSHRDRHVYRYLDGYLHGDADGHHHLYTECDQHRHAAAVAHADSYANGHRYTDRVADSDGHTDFNGHGYRGSHFDGHGYHGSDVNRHTDSHADFNGHRYNGSHIDGHGYRGSDVNRHTDGHTDFNGHGYRGSHFDGHADRRSNGYCYANGYP